VAAFLSGDRKLKEAFAQGKDIHAKVASEVFNVPFEKVTSDMRRNAKIINFGIIYGMGINSLKKNLHCSREEAEAFYQEYFSDFAGMTKYFETVKEQARKKGFTETLFKRRRYLPEINSPIEFIRKEAERMAINAPIQGTAADIIKMAMVRIVQECCDKHLKEKVHLLLQVHDELIFEIKKDTLDQAARIIRNTMETDFLSGVPLLVEVGVGNNWAELKKYSIK
jgi:DNA polymerase-1